jgi:hypothetical protein
MDLLVVQPSIRAGPLQQSDSHYYNRRLKSALLPAMIRGMTRLDGDESPVAGSRNVVIRDQLACDNRAIVLHLNHTRNEPQQSVGRRWAQQLDRVIRRYCAGRMIRAIALHQMICRGPVAVAVEQRADDATTQHPGEGFLVSLRLKFRHDFIAMREAANVQATIVCLAAAEAGVVWGVSFLKAFNAHNKNRFPAKTQSEKETRNLMTIVCPLTLIGLSFASLMS